MAERLFLIDGSSQMYRAYHAMRGGGLCGPGGRTTHAVYIFVTMLRKLIAGSRPAATSPRRSTCPARRSAPISPTDYKANRAPMPPDLAEQIPLGPRGLRSARRADPHLGAVRGRRRDRHAGRAGASRRGFEVAIVTGDKDFFQLVARRHHGLQPARRRHVVRRRGREGEVRRAPEQVVDVLALMGDSIDNIKGVPGIGEKGARDLIATYGILEALLAHAGEVSNKRYREGLLAPRGRRAAEPRAGAHPHRRAGRRSTPRRCVSRRRRASAASSCSPGSASGRWSWSTRRPRRPSARTTRRRRRRRRSNALVGGAARRRTVRVPGAAGCAGRRCAPASPASRSRSRRPPRALRAADGPATRRTLFGDRRRRRTTRRPGRSRRRWRR